MQSKYCNNFTISLGQDVNRKFFHFQKFSSPISQFSNFGNTDIKLPTPGKNIHFFLTLGFHHASSPFKFLSFMIKTAPEPSLRGAIAKTAIKIVRNLQNN
jgi:hypothetical protein